MSGLVISTLPLVYFMMKLSADPHVFFWHYLCTIVLASVYISIGIFFSYASPTFEVAQAIVQILAPLFFLFGGMWSPPSQMPAGSKWFTYIDPITYAFKAVIPIHFWCDAGAACPTVLVPSTRGLVQQDRYAYISEKYEIYYGQRWESLGYLALFFVAFQLLSFVAVARCRHIKR